MAASAPGRAPALIRSAGTPLVAGHAQDRQVVARVEVHRLGVQPLARSPSDLHRRVVLAGHHVGVGHHQPVARHPAAALHAEPAGRAQHADHAARGRRAPGGRRRSPGRARATSGWGPRMPGNGSKRASVLSSGPLGGSAALSCCRITERWIGSRSSRAPGVCSATAPRQPDQPQPDRGHQHRAAQAVERARAPARAGPRRRKPSTSRRRGQDAAHQQRAHQREQRGVGRARALREEHRARRASRGSRRPRTRRATVRPRSGPARTPRQP